MSSVSSTAAAAAIRAAERRLIERFHQGGALTPEAAAPLPDLSAPERLRLRVLLRAGVVREASPGSFYLDPSALADHEAAERRRVVWMGLTLLLLFALALLLGG